MTVLKSFSQQIKRNLTTTFKIKNSKNKRNINLKYEVQKIKNFFTQNKILSKLGLLVPIILILIGICATLIVIYENSILNLNNSTLA